MKRPTNLPTAARGATALTGSGGLMKRRMMILAMLGMSVGFVLFGAQPTAAQRTGTDTTYNVTQTGNYTITVRGADGGNSLSGVGGSGATVTATFALQSGDALKQVTGRKGETNSSGGGGGGSAVILTRGGVSSLLIVGGGGGGGSMGGGGNAANGTAGGGGSTGSGSAPGGGGGFNANGQVAFFTGGRAGTLTGGGNGGDRIASASSGDGGYGFGGGGGGSVDQSGGGGGGYGGGNASFGNGGQGGSSFVDASGFNVARTNGASGGGSQRVGAVSVNLIQPLSLVVDTTSDDGSLSACTSAAGDCSLRGAIAAANSSSTDDAISFDIPTTDSGYDAANNRYTITLGGTELTIANNGTLTINGPGANQLTVSGNNASRVFSISDTGANATISGITVTGGNISNALGGGIRNLGTLNLTNCAVSGNTTNSFGGGIYNQNGTLNLTNSTVSGNSSYEGGGIFTNYFSTLNLTNSTVSSNTAVLGGGIYNNGANAATNLINSTISGNSAQLGGGIYAGAASNNQGGTSTSRNSIIANSTGGDCLKVSTATVSFQNSLVEDGSCGVTSGVNGNLTGDPNLGALQNNGGPTPTHALLPGSIAINAGSNALAVDQNGNPLLTDQRGAGYPRIGGASVDIGALEANNTAPTISGTTLTRTAGSALSNSQIATVSDTESGAGGVTVTITSANPANGVTVSNISNSNGVVTADVKAACGATNASFTLTATDGGATNTSTLSVNVNANTPPTLTYPSNPGTTYGTGLTINPLSGPSDNGSVQSVAVFSITPSNPGGITVNNAGVVSVANTVPVGMYTVTIRAVDDCGGAGGTTAASFTLGIVKATPVITWNTPANITYGTALSATQLNATTNTAGTFTYTPAAGTVLNAGNGQLLTVNFTPSDTTNYNSTSKQVAINVLKAPLTVTVNNAARNQGQANPPLLGSITGLKNGDVITASYSTMATIFSAPGNYPITATLSDPGNRLSNYQVTNTPGTLKVFNSCGINPVPFFATVGVVGGYWNYYQPLSASPPGIYAFSLYAGMLPPGLSIVNYGGQYTLQGTPTTRGVYTFTLLAKNTGSSCEAMHTYTITIQ